MGNGRKSRSDRAHELARFLEQTDPELIAIFRKVCAPGMHHPPVVLTKREQRLLDDWLHPRIEGLVDVLMETYRKRLSNDRRLGPPEKAVDLKKR